MKLATIIAAALAVTNVQAITTALWGENSASAFNLTITGTGTPVNETFTSPSGLWEVNANIWGALAYWHPGLIEISNSAYAYFLGLPERPRLASHGYNDTFPIGSRLVDGSREELGLSDSVFQPWKMNLPFEITSTPDLEDNSTWTWVMNISAHGPSLAQNVPEGGSAWLMMAFASGILLCFRPKSA